MSENTANTAISDKFWMVRKCHVWSLTVAQIAQTKITANPETMMIWNSSAKTLIKFRNVKPTKASSFFE